MKYIHKVFDHKRKVEIDFESFSPYSLGIRGQKQVQNKHFSCLLLNNFSIIKWKSMKF